MTELTAEKLRDLFDYDPETGKWTRRPRRDVRPCWNSRYVNKPVGTVSKSTGYLIINIDKRLYGAHRLAWLYVNGHWPVGHLDHKDNNRTNNRIANLRGASDTQNRANQKVRVDSESGLKGVRFKSGKWYARITKHGEILYLGSFYSKDEASEIYFEKAIELFGEFARLQ